MAGISESPHFGSQPDEGAAYEAGLKTAQDTVEKLNNSIQQLKAEIAAYYAELNNITNRDGILIADVMARLRQLSAI
jgi:conjugal transfer/entry exclusion protein